jgi:Bacteriophage Lambda NinG protein
VKTKVCRACKAEYAPQKMGQKVCSPPCAMKLVFEQQRKEDKKAKTAERKADAIKREKLKSKAQWAREAQTAFNQFIRERDRHAGHACISSGKPLDWNGNAVDAGHYRSRGSAPHLRFDERNCHAQSKHDNRYASGNVVGYRAGLIERIGLDAVEGLESDQTPRRYTIDDLRAIKRDYAAKVKELRALV